MLRVLSQTFLGLVLLAAGVYLALLFLQGLADGPDLWTIASATPITVSGIFLLHRAGKSDATVMKKTTIPTLGDNKEDGAPTGFAAKIAQDNQMIKDWGNTVDTRNQLKVLQSASAADKES